MARAVPRTLRAACPPLVARGRQLRSLCPNPDRRGLGLWWSISLWPSTSAAHGPRRSSLRQAPRLLQLGLPSVPVGSGGCAGRRELGTLPNRSWPARFLPCRRARLCRASALESTPSSGLERGFAPVACTLAHGTGFAASCATRQGQPAWPPRLSSMGSPPGGRRRPIGGQPWAATRSPFRRWEPAASRALVLAGGRSAHWRGIPSGASCCGCWPCPRGRAHPATRRRR